MPLGSWWEELLHVAQEELLSARYPLYHLKRCVAPTMQESSLLLAWKCVFLLIAKGSNEMANQRSAHHLRTSHDYGRLIHRPTHEHYARLHAARYSERMPQLPLIIITILSIAAFGACAFTAMPAVVAFINSNNATIYPTPAPFTPLPPSPSPTYVFLPAKFVTTTVGVGATTTVAPSPNATPQPSPTLSLLPTSQPATATPTSHLQRHVPPGRRRCPPSLVCHKRHSRHHS
jgi:hypothetical protein